MRTAIALVVVGGVLLLAGCGLLDGLLDGQAPTASLTASPSAGPTPLLVHFDGSRSSDDGRIIEYVWDYGDGDSETSSQAHAINHRYERPGQYTATLTVVDDDGHAHTESKTIAVENRPPLASCKLSSDAPIVGERIQFDASGSFDLDGDLIDFRWEFGDGETAHGTRVSHVYNEETVCTMRLIVEDDAGGTASIEHTMTVHLGGSGGCGGGSGVCF